VDSEAALDVLHGSEDLTAPALIRVEVASALARKTRLRELPPDETEAGLELWLETLSSGALPLVSDDTDLRRAVNFSVTLNHPVPDCLYLALAARLGALLVTADRRFHRRALEAYREVTLLS
jgi:predicted nucleic acid-binding protein